MRHLVLCALLLSSAINALAFDEVIQERHDSILAGITGSTHGNQKTRLITDFGAKGNGVHDCKKAFDKAMREAAKTRDGLHIIVPAGKWFVKGPIHFVSNVTLELQEGSTILFSPNGADYLPMVKTSWEGVFCQNYSPMIYGNGVKNVAIIGSGTIDGNCAETFPAWRTQQKAAQMQSRQYAHQEMPVEERNFGEGCFLRPHFIQFLDSEGITLDGFMMINSPFWCVHLLRSENIICRKLRYNTKLMNNDGIDPEMSRNILIEDVAFTNGDDNIAIKAGRDNDGWNDMARPSENIIIRNCRFKGLHGVVIGSEMSAGVRNVFVENCSHDGYVKRGLYVKTNPNRGGYVHDIYFENCSFGEVEDLFYITSMYAGEGKDDIHFTDIHDIHVRNVSCRKASNAGIILQGTEAKPLYNISFDNVSVEKTSIGFTSSNTLDIIMRNCMLGGKIDSAPSQVSDKDNLFGK